MSADPESNTSGDVSEALTSLDLTGLPTPVVAALRNLVATLRASFPAAPGPQGAPVELPPDEWARRLREWSNPHPARPIEIDDDRETIYEGRGE
jgi:hypothetical protein